MRTKTKSLLLALLVFATTLVGTLSAATPVFAAPSTPEAEARGYLYYKAIAGCFRVDGNDVKQAGQLTQGAWFGSHTVDIGYALSGNEGTASCSDTNMIKTAVALWGYSDPRAAWCDVMQHASVSSDCAVADQMHTDGDRQDSFKWTIEEKFFGGRGDHQLSPEAQYWLYLTTFFTACKASEVQGSGDYTIKIVNSSGDIEEKHYSATAQSTGTQVDANGNVIQQGQGGIDKDSRVKTWDGFSPTCGELAQWTSNAADAYGRYTKAHPDAALPTNQASGANSGTTGDKTISCGGGDWDWAICPFILLAQEGAIKLDGFITNLLNINADTIFDTSVLPGKSYYAAWNTFRIIATALIVIAGLVMVISQALGFEFLDAYTIRKVLPRLVIAVIGISLSWPIMGFFVNLFNTIGFDIRSLMYEPFTRLGGGINPALGLSSYLAVLGGTVLLGGLGLLSLIGTALLAMLVAFFILVIRQIAVIVLVVLAPVAIACYILPNTHKGWKLWYDSFLGVLLMFPIVSAFIAAGHIFAAVAVSPGAGGDQFGSNTLAQVVGIVAYFLPYFMLPIAFRLATGLISTLAGFVNDRSRGGFDRLKKYRQTKSAENMAAMKEGTRFNNRGLNALTSRATTSRMGFGKRGQAAYEQKLSAAAMADAKGKGMAIQHNDGALRAATYGSAMEARANMKKDWGMNDPAEIESAIAAVKASGGFGRSRQVYAASQLSATGTGYDNIQQLSKTIARVSNGNEGQMASLAGNINSGTKQAGRFDLAPGFSNLNELARREAGLKATPNEKLDAFGAAPNANGTPSAANYAAASVAAARGADAVSMLRGKPKEVGTLTKSLAAHARNSYARSQNMGLKDEVRAAAKDEFLQTMGQIDQLNQSKSYASHENQEHVNNLLNDTRDLRTQVLDGVIGNQPPVGPPPAASAAQNRTQEQVNDRERYNQMRSPRINPDDPNSHP